MKIRSIVTAAVIFVVLSTRMIRADQVSDALDTAQRALENSNVWNTVNTSIDTAMRSSGLATHAQTRVVPIVGYGGAGASLRLAQISGPSSAVSRVRAVMEIDSSGRREGPWQFTALVPVASIDRRGYGQRVDGVGITALITR